jgi:predicted lipoprotein
MRALKVVLIAVGILAASPTARAEDASAVYEARYRLTGFLLRAANVCEADKQQVAASFVLVQSPEMKAFSKAFPAVTEKWMLRGAEWFNELVMKGGLQPACDYALDTLKKANAQ